MAREGAYQCSYSRNGEYEPYAGHEYPLGEVTLRGIPKLENGKLYYDGDTYESDGTVTRKYGIVDLGTLNWVQSTVVNTAFYVAFASTVLPSSSAVPNMKASNYYKTVSYADRADKTVYVYSGAGGTTLSIRDDAYTDAAQFKTHVNGVYLVYELATPTTESADPYQNPQIVNDFGTEEYVDERTVPIPVGHESFYMTDLKKKIELLPDIPSAPTANGTYVLKCTVANGIPTFAWQSA